MLRNAVDHGLETPEEREAAGKDPVGTIALSAHHAGSSVAIEVRDDGRGIDPDALRRSAVAKGLLDERAAAALSADEATALVLMPGFSTAATTTDISGRGVGLDAVNTKIAALGGELRITSRPGEGSTFTVRLPLTLAIITALLVRAGGEGRVYALPLDAIEETVVVGDDDVRSVRGRPCIVLRDAVVPLVSLSERLGMGGEEPSGRREVVVVRSGGARVGVAVDALVGQQDIVIKSLPPYLGETAALSGATILGDGSVALVVDAAALAARRESVSA
jgi:two-component system chemotaxis sensor kinase CheA